MFLLGQNGEKNGERGDEGWATKQGGAGGARRSNLSAKGNLPGSLRKKSVLPHPGPKLGEQFHAPACAEEVTEQHAGGEPQKLITPGNSLARGLHPVG